jgi:hypothetical protein
MNCGECLMNDVELVALLPSGACPRCGTQYDPQVLAAGDVVDEGDDVDVDDDGDDDDEDDDDNDILDNEDEAF